MQVLNTIIKAALAIAFAASVAAPAAADTIALTPVALIGNQAWNGSLAMDFTVRSVIRISQLGAFDSNQDGFSGPISIGIYDAVSGQLIQSTVINPADASTLVGTNRFVDVDSFNLGIGTYSIVAQGFGVNDLNGNTGVSSGFPAPTIDTAGGAIAFVGTSHYGFNQALEYPTQIDGGPANRYSAGTFAFTEVPEPATVALFGFGLLGLAMARRRSK